MKIFLKKKQHLQIFNDYLYFESAHVLLIYIPAVFKMLFHLVDSVQLLFISFVKFFTDNDIHFIVLLTSKLPLLLFQCLVFVFFLHFCFLIIC